MVKFKLIFCRYHKKNETKIRNDIYNDAKLSGSFLNFDAESFHLHCGGKRRPPEKEKYNNSFEENFWGKFPRMSSKIIIGFFSMYIHFSNGLGENICEFSTLLLTKLVKTFYLTLQSITRESNGRSMA